MKVYALNLPGFDGVDDTVLSVKWIQAPSMIKVANFLLKNGVIGSIEAVDGPVIFGIKDGVDVILDEEGEVVEIAKGVDVSTWKYTAATVSTEPVEKKEPSKRDKFIRLLAEYLVSNQAEMGIKIQLGKPDALNWAAMRGLSPLFGYQTVDEGEKLLKEFLNNVN